MSINSFDNRDLNPYVLANIAKLSYYNENEFKEEIYKFTNPNNIYFYDLSIDEYSDAQMYTLIYKDKIVFSIRGTSSIKDVINDINFIKTTFQDVQYTVETKNNNKKKYKNIKVHKGFLSQYNTIKFRIISYVFSALWGNKSKDINDKIHIIFTSHSLGAAISTLTSTMLKAHFGNKIFLENWAFGCPSVGNNYFVKYYNDNIDISHIYIYGNDIITRIPKIGFKKFNNCIYLKNEYDKSSYYTNKMNVYFGNINDHYIDNYIRALNTNATISNLNTTISNNYTKKQNKNLFNNKVINFDSSSIYSTITNNTNNNHINDIKYNDSDSDTDSNNDNHNHNYNVNDNKQTNNTMIVTITQKNETKNNTNINININISKENDLNDSLYDKSSINEDDNIKINIEEKNDKNNEKTENKDNIHNNNDNNDTNINYNNINDNNINDNTVDDNDIKIKIKRSYNENNEYNENSENNENEFIISIYPIII